MKALIFVFSLAFVGGHRTQWKGIGDLKDSINGYNESAEKLLESGLKMMHNNQLNVAEFLDRLASDYLLKTPELNETTCYRTLFNLTRIQRSIQSEILRSQVPLKNLLVELGGKLAGINNTMNIAQDLADGKYSICKFIDKNASCEEETDLWLEDFLSSVRCQIAPTCRSHALSKRSANNYCFVGQFACGSGECISLNYLCDRESHCSDGSDEGDLMCCYNNYNGLPMRCKDSGNCFERSMMCDGIYQCEDSTDELYCGRITNNCSIEYGLHKCDNKCIGLDKVCDGTQDCRDGSDEGPLCGEGLCPEDCSRKGGVCYHGPSGPQCLAQCPLGTFEAPEGCTAHPQPTNRTVLELMEEIPKLILRQNAKLTYIKIKATETIAKIMSDVFFCLDPNYSTLAKALRVPIKNKTDDGHFKEFGNYSYNYVTKSEVTTEKSPSSLEEGEGKEANIWPYNI